MTNYHLAQLERLNRVRRLRGQPLYRNVRECLIDQGHTEAEASKLAAAAEGASPDAAKASSLEPGAIYARANRSYRQRIYGRDEPAAASEERAGPDLTHGGRRPGIHSPRDYPASLEDDTQESAEERSGYAALAVDAYAGPINATYRRATEPPAAKACA